MRQQKHISHDKESLHATVAHHLQQGDTMALWQLPHTNTITFLACSAATPFSTGFPVTTLTPGFIVAPFDRRKGYLFLPADNVYTFDNTITQPDKPTDSPSLSFHTLPISPMTSEEHKSSYLGSVGTCIDHIRKGFFKKAVLTRREVKALPKEKSINPLNLFQQLCILYPHAFVSLVSAPATGTWVGASPELLLSLDNKLHIKTEAIAGTQQVIPKHDMASIRWTQKEREEQALVSRYVAKCFERVGINTFEQYGPATYRAGNVLHLKTDFTVNTLKTHHLQLGSDVLNALHPTPAVCGLPQQAAETFLSKHEPFERQFYSGYIGPVHFQQESHIYVNLRCMQWGSNALALYAGAGITRDSIPEKEWEETAIKMNTLLHALSDKARGRKPLNKQHAY